MTIATKLTALIAILLTSVFLLANNLKQTSAQEVTVTASVNFTILTFRGTTEPNAFVSFSQNNEVIGTTTSGTDGTFTKTFTGYQHGTHTFTITARNADNVTTAPYSFEINVIPQTETIVSEIVLPPTVNALSKTRYRRDEPVNVSGRGPPNAMVTVFVEKPLISFTVTSDGTGVWARNVNQNLQPGTYKTYAKIVNLNGGQSINSKASEFSIVPLPGCSASADINRDGRVNLQDFSIMMFDWETSRSRSDLNCDDVVNLTDFSILLFNWTN